jgi:hypothetical protein
MPTIGAAVVVRDEAAQLLASLFRRGSADEVVARLTFAEVAGEHPGLSALGHRG